MNCNSPITIPSTFEAFSPRKPVERGTSRLPHWEVENATYFITFREHGSLPQTHIERWASERREFEEQLAQVAGAEHQALFRQFQAWKKQTRTTEEHCLDRGLGPCQLARPENHRLVMESLQFHDGTKYCLFGAVIMPNHVHLLLQPLPGHTHGRIIAGIKSFTAREINKRDGSAGRSFWQRDRFDRIIRDADHFKKALRYIMRNPERAGLPPGQAPVYVSGTCVDEAARTRGA